MKELTTDQARSLCAELVKVLVDRTTRPSEALAVAMMVLIDVVIVCELPTDVAVDGLRILLTKERAS